MKFQHEVGSEELVLQPRPLLADHPAEGAWHHSPKNSFVLSPGLRAAILLPMVCVVITEILVTESFKDVRLIFLLVAIATLVIVVAATSVGVLATQKVGGVFPAATPVDLALLTDSQGATIAVEVVVMVNWNPVARDRGVLGFHEDALFFSGHSFSFLIGSQDIAPGETEGSRQQLPGNKIMLSHPSNQVLLNFSALQGGPWNWKEKTGELASMLREFQRAEPTSHPRQYPPLEPWSRDDPK